jgi:hypothetical protein
MLSQAESNPAKLALHGFCTELHANSCFVLPTGADPQKAIARNRLMLFEKLVLPDRIELSTSPLPMECSTTELRQRAKDHVNRPKRLP